MSPAHWYSQYEWLIDIKTQDTLSFYFWGPEKQANNLRFHSPGFPAGQRVSEDHGGLQHLCKCIKSHGEKGLAKFIWNLYQNVEFISKTGAKNPSNPLK